MFANIFIISLSTFLILFFILRKFNILVDNRELSFHKKLVIFSSKPILIGGIYILVLILFSFPKDYLFLKLICFLILLIGILSDIDYLNSPLKRIIIQFFLVLFFVLIENIFIRSLSIDFLDNLLKINIINILLTIFCFLVLINGTNFLDGLNGLVSGYFIISISSILFLADQNLINLLYQKEITYLLIGLIIFFVFNMLGLTFLGDGGAYILAAIIGYIFISNFNSNLSISPYFIALLLWYPAFENLFSLSRRLLSKIKVSDPDNLHLHQLIYLKIKNKIINNKLTNSISSIIILIYNLLILVVATNNYSSTKIMVSLIIFNVFVYSSLYYFFSKYSEQNK
tara:strand:- start:774 stop:1799 length:1026 start_codon:yes stop_codon:yes gene_type:complete